MSVGRNAVIIFALALPASGAASHDRWANGDPVPAYVKDSCCGPVDAHHLRADQVHVVQGGYKVDGYEDIIPEAKMQPSPDGEYWGFWRELSDGHQSPLYCFFGPLRGA